MLAIPPKIAFNHQNLIDSQILDLDDMDRLIPYLWRQYKNYSNNFITLIQIGNQKNEYRVAGQTYRQGKLITGVATSGKMNNFTMQGYLELEKFQKLTDPVFEIDDYDTAQRPWYKQAVTTKKMGWTGIYPRTTDRSSLVIAFTNPLYSLKEKKNQAASSVVLDLRYINQFLQSLKIGKTGQPFIV